MANNPFLEERLPVTVRLGASYNDDYEVEITRTASGQEHRKLIHPFPVRRFAVRYTKTKGDIYDQLLALYSRTYGRFKGFRVQAMDDYSTNGATGAPTHLDQALGLISAGVYQLRKVYGGSGAARTLFKPQSGTVLLGINTALIRSADWSVDTATGLITLAANKTFTIIGISKAASAVITVPSHTVVVGQSVHISGVLGMTEINGLRGFVINVTDTEITIGINSTAFSTWTSGGVGNTNPQTGEAVTGGCLFDIPCRFDGVIDVTPLSPNYAETGEIMLVELINP